MSDVYFEGDPEIDSARRRLERILKGEPPPPRWPWIVAALGGGSLWMMWRWGRDAHAKNVADEGRMRKPTGAPHARARPDDLPE